LSKRKGTLFVISGPSGAGKGTVLKSFLEQSGNEDVFLSVSATTRAPRAGETDGVNYYYKTTEEFESMIANDQLFEWASFCGNYYGTPKEPVLRMLEEGKDVILEIEVQGAMKVKEAYPVGVTIFVLPPSFEELRNRIVGRKTESEEVIDQRLKTAAWEFTHITNYDYILLNDTVEDASQRLKSIVEAERCRVDKNLNLIEEVLGK